MHNPHNPDVEPMAENMDFIDDTDRNPEDEERAREMLHAHLKGTVGYHT